MQLYDAYECLEFSDDHTHDSSHLPIHPTWIPNVKAYLWSSTGYSDIQLMSVLQLISFCQTTNLMQPQPFPFDYVEFEKPTKLPIEFALLQEINTVLAEYRRLTEEHWLPTASSRKMERKQNKQHFAVRNLLGTDLLA